MDGGEVSYQAGVVIPGSALLSILPVKSAKFRGQIFCSK